MRPKSLVIVLAVVAGIVTSLLGALFGSVLFHNGSLMERLVSDVAPQEWLTRIAIVAAFTLFGVIVSGFIEEEEDELTEVEEPETPLEDTHPERFANDAQVMIVGLDLDGRVTFFNRYAEETTDRSRDEVLGQGFFDVLVPPRSLPLLLPTFESVIQRGVSAHREAPWVNARRGEMIVSSHLSPVRDDRGNVVGVVVVGEEVTEFRWSEVELEESRHPYRPLVETMMGDGLAATDTSGAITWVSESLAEMLGRDRSELQGTDVLEIAITEDRERLKRHMAECLQDGERISLEVMAAAPDGRRIPVAITAVSLVGPEGEPAGSFAFIRDISDSGRAAPSLAVESRDARDELQRMARKLRDAEARAEQAREETREEFERTLAEMSAQLEEAERRAEEALQAAQAGLQSREATVTEQQERIEALERELAEAREAAQAHLQSRDATVAEQQERIEGLERELAEAREAAEVHLQSRDATVAEQQERIEALERELAQAREAAQAHLRSREAALAEQQERIEALERELAEAREAAQAHVQSRDATVAEQQERIEALEGQIAEIEEARAALLAEHESEIDELRERLAGAQRVAEEVEEQVEHAREVALAEQQGRVDELRRRLADAERVTVEAREEHAREVERLSAEAERLSAEAAEARELLESREAIRADFAARFAGLSQTLAGIERQHQEARDRAREQHEAEVERLAARIAQAERAVAQARDAARAEQQARIEELEAQVEDVERQVGEARQAAREEYESEIARMLAEVDEQKRLAAQARDEALAEQQAVIDDLEEELEEARREVVEALEAVERLEPAPVPALGDAPVGDAELDSAEAARLLESLAFLRALLDGISYPVFFADMGGRYQSCNVAFARGVLGLSRGDVLGKTPRELGESVPAELVEALQRGDREVRKRGDDEVYEAAVPCADGGTRTYAVRKHPYRDRDGEMLGVIGAMMDISGLQEAQEALEQERRQSAAVLSRAPAIIAEIRPDGTTTAVYGDCEQVLGYQAEELVGRNWWQTFFPEDLYGPIPDVLGTMRGGGDLNDEALTMWTGAGEERTISWTTANVFDEGRQLVSILAVGYDITDRARSTTGLELRLTDSLERIKKYECLCNAMRITQDPNLTLTEVLSGIVASLPRAWRYPGITTARVTVWDRERTAGEAPGPAVATQSADIVVNGEVAGQIEVRYHAERPHLQEGPFTLEERELLDVLAQRLGDTVERRSAEEGLAKLQEFRSTLIEQANVWLMALDRDRNVVLWNCVAEQMSGYSRGEVVGHDGVWEWLYPDAEYRAEVLEALTEVTFGAREAEDWETVIRRKDNSEHLISWNAHRLMSDDGATLGCVALGRDVTEQSAAVGRGS